MFTIYTQGQPANQQPGAVDLAAALDIAWLLAKEANSAATVLDEQGTEVAQVSITWPAPAEPAQG